MMHLARQPGGSQENRLVGLLAIHPAQPQMKPAVGRLERHRLLTLGDAAVPLRQTEISAAKKIMRQGIVGRGVNPPPERGNGLIDAAIGDERGSGLIRPGASDGNAKNYDDGK